MLRLHTSIVKCFLKVIFSHLGNFDNKLLLYLCVIDFKKHVFYIHLMVFYRFIMELSHYHYYLNYGDIKDDP